MKAAAVLVGCLVALASTEPSTEPPQRMEVIKWILNVIKFDTATNTTLPPITDLPTTTSNSSNPQELTTSKPKPQEPNDKCPTCECGKARVRSRIVGGSETKLLEFPWMALLTWEKEMKTYMCGGSVINDRYVLTAAQCVARFTKDDNVTVTLLEHDRLVADETTPVVRKVANIIKHSHYDKPTHHNHDIALLKLDQKVELGQAVKQSNNSHKADDLGVRTICLPPGGHTFANEKATVIGWGKTTDGGDFSDKLMQVTVPILSNEDCHKTAYHKEEITDNMMCAGGPEGRHDSCKGDTGGPLQVLNHKTGTHMQVGVVSWGAGCAIANYPGVYTRVNRYLEWIKQNTRDACYCT